MSAKDTGGSAFPSCGYQGYEFGAGSYPDSVCIDGSLHDADGCDADGNVYINDEDIPCPMCRPLDAIERYADSNALFWDDDEDEKNEAGHLQRARKSAISLVTDIRRNRGAETDLAMLAVSTGPQA